MCGGGVTYNDLAYLIKEGLVATAAAEEKLVMVVLIRKQLHKHLDKRERNVGKAGEAVKRCLSQGRRSTCLARTCKDTSLSLP